MTSRYRNEGRDRMRVKRPFNETLLDCSSRNNTDVRNSRVNMNKGGIKTVEEKRLSSGSENRERRGIAQGTNPSAKQGGGERISRAPNNTIRFWSGEFNKWVKRTWRSPISTKSLRLYTMISKGLIWRKATAQCEHRAQSEQAKPSGADALQLAQTKTLETLAAV